MPDVFETFIPIDWEKFSAPESFGKQMNYICQAIIDNRENIDHIIYSMLNGLKVSAATQMIGLEATKSIPFIQKGTFTPYIYWNNTDETHRSSGTGVYVQIGPLQVGFFQITVNSNETNGANNIIRMSGLPYCSSLISAMRYIGGKVFLDTPQTSIQSEGYAYDLLQTSGQSYAYLVAPPPNISSYNTGYVHVASTASDMLLENTTKVSGYIIALK